MSTTHKSSLLSIIFVSLISLSPQLKSKLWKKWYNLLARHDNQLLLASMNYGYIPDNAATMPDDISPQLALYEHITNNITLKNKRVVEIGSGRGAGAIHLTRNYQPAVLIGVDIARHACKNSDSYELLDNIHFISGDALAIPIKPGTIDVVINVESAHCYSDLGKFIKEVSMLLTLDGYFCFCDLIAKDKVDELRRYIKSNQLTIIEDNDITKNILASLDQNSSKHSLQIDQNVPWYLKKAFSDFVGISNTSVYNLFKSGKYAYYSFLVKKEKFN